jgi:hypothetical protein
MNNRYPGELYLAGGDNPPATYPVPPGPYVAKVNPVTGAQIWRTVLDDANVTHNWIAGVNLNILADGNIVFAWSKYVVLLDPDTGEILKQRELPEGTAGFSTLEIDGKTYESFNGNYKHLTVAPDGTLIIKQQNRPFNCTTQGAGALISCPGANDGGLYQGNSTMVAVDPKTLEVYDSILLPTMTATPHIITMFHGRIAIYTAGSTTGLTNLYRYFWDPKTNRLSQDMSFIVPILQPGQSSGDAPGILGNWVVIQTNGAPPVNVSSSIVAVNQDDPTKVTTINPFYPAGPLPDGLVSSAPPKAAVDDENDMIYSDDYGVAGVAGIKFDRKTGQMTTAFVLNDRTTCLQALIGPKQKRVLAVSRIDPNATPGQLQNGTYTEQATFRDAATGRLLAQSDFFDPMTSNTLITPAFGGGFYFPMNDGFMILEVSPAGDEHGHGKGGRKDDDDD